jgi:hypothetical protein
VPPPDVLIIPGAPGSAGIEVGLFGAIRAVHVKRNSSH